MMGTVAGVGFVARIRYQAAGGFQIVPLDI